MLNTIEKIEDFGLIYWRNIGLRVKKTYISLLKLFAL